MRAIRADHSADETVSGDSLLLAEVHLRIAFLTVQIFAGLIERLLAGSQ